MLKVIKYYSEIRTGSSLPLIIGANDGKKYVVKLRGSGDGILANSVEWIAIRLGQLLEIPILEPALLLVENDFVREEIDPEIKKLIEKSSGINFGTGFLENASEYNGQESVNFDDNLKNQIFLFDLFLLNIDRNSQNPNMLWDNNKLWCLDYASSMTIRNAIDESDYSELSLLKEIKKHPFYKDRLAAYHFIKKVKAIGGESIRNIIDELPEEWLLKLHNGSGSRKTRKMITERLIAKKNNANFLHERLDILRVLKLETEEERQLKSLRNKQTFEEKFGKF